MDAGGSGRHESPEERADRNLTELLAELRVALPGVQVLFAFLLVVPFQPRFSNVSAFTEKVYLATLIATALASVLLIAPSVHHRITFRHQEKERVVVAGNRLALAGLTALAIAMIGVTLLVTDFVFGSVTTAIVTAAVTLLFALTWYLVPLRWR